MNKIDKIKAEIERRLRLWDEMANNSPEGQGRDTCISRITELKDLFSFINSLPEEKPSRDLEEAAAEFAEREYVCGSIDRDALEKGFYWGAQWQKEQMMKDSISCEVVGEKRDLRLISSTERCLFDAKRGDWLKIIIVKED